jgi:hypothetical protein
MPRREREREMADRDSEPKPFAKGLLDGDLGATSRAGRIRVLEGLMADLDASIRPVQERLRALQSIVDQERDALFMDERRAQRARERAEADDKAMPKDPTTAAASIAAKDRPMAQAAAAATGARPKYPANSDGVAPEPTART